MTNVIELKNITKDFPGIRANDDISLDLRKGEIHALLGENGAGKSTLMSILFGMYKADGGQIFVNGKEAKIKNPNDANRLGIGMVHQHFKLVGCYTALQNIILGYEPTTRFFGFLKPKIVRKSLEDLCQKYKFKIGLDDVVDDMPIGEQQKVEILKMLYRNNDILIFDEPTAVLTPQEIEDLMASMRELTKEGKSILFISHKLNEIMEVADRVTVLRKGKCLGTLEVKDTNPQELSRLMVGREVALKVEKSQAKPGEDILTVRNFTVYNEEKKKDVVRDVSFDVKKGEIVCIAGIEGNGQTDLIYALTGLEAVKSGEAILRHVDSQRFAKPNKAATQKTGFSKKFYAFRNGCEYSFSFAVWFLKYHATNGMRHLDHFVHPKEAFIKCPLIKPLSPKEKAALGRYYDVHLEDLSVRRRSIAGVAHIPEDRQKYGLALDFSLKDNLVLQRYFEHKFQRFGFIQQKAKDDYARKLISEYDIRSSLGGNTLVRSMSGGNQQKAIVAREMDRNTPLLIAVQPTRGLDVGAIEYIHRQIVKKRDEGSGILLVSLELEEVMNLSDRILVMFNGEIVAELNPKETNLNEIGLYMSGAKRMNLTTHQVVFDATKGASTDEKDR